MTTNNGETGARYNFTRTMMQKFLQEKVFNLGVLNPIEYTKAGNIHDLGYTLTIATDNAEGVEEYIRSMVLAAHQYERVFYDIEVYPTRLRSMELRTKHPMTVCFKMFKYARFCFKDIVDNVSGNHYLSNTYNNGMLPCSIIQYHIPPKYQHERCRELERNRMENGGAIDIYTMGDYDAHLLRKIWVEDQIEELTIYMGHEDGYPVDHTVISYTISPKCVVFRERPLLPKATVEVVDCLPVKESIGYQKRCGFKNKLNYMTANDREKMKSLSLWADFLRNRTMTRIGSPINDISETGDLLMSLLKVTLPDELPKGLNIVYFEDMNKTLNGNTNEQINF